MAKLEERLVAGLEAQDWQETASRGPWRRFAKWGRGAYYLICQQTTSHSDQDKDCLPGELWFSELYESWPRFKVTGPILDQLLLAGDKQLAQERVDTQALLIELLYSGEKHA